MGDGGEKKVRSAKIPLSFSGSIEIPIKFGVYWKNMMLIMCMTVYA